MTVDSKHCGECWFINNATGIAAGLLGTALFALPAAGVAEHPAPIVVGYAAALASAVVQLVPLGLSGHPVPTPPAKDVRPG